MSDPSEFFTTEQRLPQVMQDFLQTNALMMQTLQQNNLVLAQVLEQLTAALSKPRRLITNQAGQPIGSTTVDNLQE